MNNHWTYLRLTLALAAAFALSGSIEARGQAQDVPLKSKFAKIQVIHSRAADIARAFGMPVLGEERDPQRGNSEGPLGNLIPDGIYDLFAVTTDNTIVVSFDTLQGLEDMKELIRLLDVEPVAIFVRARAVLTASDRSGVRRMSESSAEARSQGDRSVHLKSSSDAGGLQAGAARLTKQTFDLDVRARLLGNGKISLDADWYVDLVWSVPGSAKPVRHRSVMRSNAVTSSGKTVTVSRSTLKLPSGKVELLLEITPILLERAAKAGSTPPSGAPNSRR